MSPGYSMALILRFYDAFNRRDFDGMTVCVGDHVELTVDQTCRQVGKEGLLTFYERLARQHDATVSDFVIMATSSGEYVSSEVTVRCTKPEIDEFRAAAFFTVFNDDIVTIASYFSGRLLSTDEEQIDDHKMGAATPGHSGSGRGNC